MVTCPWKSLVLQNNRKLFGCSLPVVIKEAGFEVCRNAPQEKFIMYVFHFHPELTYTTHFPSAKSRVQILGPNQSTWLWIRTLLLHAKKRLFLILPECRSSNNTVPPGWRLDPSTPALPRKEGRRRPWDNEVSQFWKLKRFYVLTLSQIDWVQQTLLERLEIDYVKLHGFFWTFW